MKTFAEEVCVEFNEYQKRAATTAVYDRKKALEYLALGLTEEAGEVAGKFSKVFRGDKSLNEQGEAIFKELGDVLWFVANLSLEMGWSLSDVAAGNLAKLADRQARGVLKGSGDNR